MIRFRPKRPRRVPGLNTASLPDLIFTVLFFFMIVTHMRKDVPMVRYQVPQGRELTRLVRKSAVSYVYIGQPVDDKGRITGHGDRIQLNDKYASPQEIGDYIRRERTRMTAEDAARMTVSLKADRHTPMALVQSVKQELRRADALRINYSADERR